MVPFILLVVFISVQLIHYKITGEFLYRKRAFAAQPDPEPVNTMPLYSRKSDENIQIAYAYLAGWIIKKNSRDSKKKVDFVRFYFERNFPNVYMSAMEKLIDSMRNETNIRSVANWILRQLPEGKERIAIIDFLFEIVKADGEIIDREFVAIVRFAELIGVKAVYIEKKISEFNEFKFRAYQDSRVSTVDSERQRHLLALNLTSDFTPEQLKRAYRKLVVKYHPDKISHLSEGEQREAKAIFLKIQAAYDYLNR